MVPLLVALSTFAAWASASGPVADLPRMTPALFPRVMEKREVVVEVSPRASHAPGKEFRVFCAFDVHAPMARVRRHLLDFPSYKTLSPTLQRVTYLPRQRLILINGSVMMLKFEAALRVQDRAPNWIHFDGLLDENKALPVDLFLKAVQTPGHGDETLVYLSGILHSDSALIPDATLAQATDLLITSIAEKLRARIESGN